MKYFLRSRGRLMEEPPVFNEGPDCFVQQPLDETSEISSIKYSTEPLNEDIEITGPMALYLFASIDQEDTNWRVTLSDVDEYGLKRYVLTEDWLKASHRAIDESKSEICRPWHPHTENESLTPGKVYDYIIALSPRSHVFKVGHRIEIDIASMDNTTGGLHICSSKTTLHKVHHDPENASYLVLPIIPEIK
jgi:putative CocE/NonD family hydrolase